MTAFRSGGVFEVIGVWMPDMRAKRNADKQIVQISNQQTGIGASVLHRYLRILAVRIIYKKLGGQIIYLCCVFHHSTLQCKGKAGRAIPSPPDGFFRSLFILPLSQNRHSTSSLGQFLFYRRVRTVTRLIRKPPLLLIIIAPVQKYVNMNFPLFHRGMNAQSSFR